MRIYFGKVAYGWRMYGIGWGTRWFLGFSMSLKNGNYTTLNKDKEGYVIGPNTIDEFDQLVKLMCYKNTTDFVKKTGVTFEDIKGKRFTSVNYRIFIKED